MLRIGVLALQGSVIEHMKALAGLEGIEPVEVRTVEELDSVDGIILPGGESTTMCKLLHDFGLRDPLAGKIRKGLPAWGTCAGLILLSQEVLDDPLIPLGVLNGRVRRNAYGSQLDSFTLQLSIPEVSEQPFDLVFIRAPWLEEVGEGVRVLAENAGKIIAVREGNVLGTSFHPELTKNKSFHEYFAQMCREAKSRP